MCTIDVKDILANKTYPDAGSELYKMIVDKIDSEDKIILNLDGVDSLPSMFLNVSLGRFVEEYGVDTLKQKISFAKISAMQIERIKEYISKVSE